MKFKSKEIDVYDVCFWGMEFFCFFPFLFPLNFLPTDTQPYALIFSLMFLFLKFFSREKWSVRKEEMQFAILCIIAMVIGLVSLCSISILAFFRAMTPYLSLFTIPKVLEFYSEKNTSRENLYKLYILIWFSVGLIQFLFDRQFLINIVSGSRISISGYRGCISLASEPSFLGVQCYYFLYISKKFKKNKFIFYVLNAIMGIIFAQSFVGILFVLSFFLQEYFDTVNEYRKTVYLILGVIIFLVSGNFLIKEFPDSRLVSLFNIMIEDGIVGLAQDASGQTRLNSIAGAVQSIIQHLFFPQGFGNRIGCAWGSLGVEIGFFSLGYIVIILRIFMKAYKRKLAKYITLILVFLLYFSNVQLSNPMFSFVIGYLLMNY